MTVQLSAAQRLGVVLVPWVFVLAFSAVWCLLLLPRAFEGHAALICVCLFAGLALACFVVAAVTFSRDVLTGRWPSGDARYRRGSVSGSGTPSK